MSHSRWRMGLVAAALLLAGCAAIPTRVDPPRISLVNLQMLSVSSREQRYRLTLRIQNPNAFNLPVSRLEYDLALNGRDFTRGVSGEPFTVPAFGEQLAAVEGAVDFAQVVEQLRDWRSGRSQALRYRLRGRLVVLKRFVRIPFEREGEVKLTW